MDTFTIVTSCFAVFSIIGAILNSRQNKYGFVVWGVTNFCWLIVDFSRGIYAQAFLYLVFIGINIYGWCCWNKASKSQNNV